MIYKNTRTIGLRACINANLSIRKQCKISGLSLNLSIKVFIIQIIRVKVHSFQYGRAYRHENILRRKSYTPPPATTTPKDGIFLFSANTYIFRLPLRYNYQRIGCFFFLLLFLSVYFIRIHLYFTYNRTSTWYLAAEFSLRSVQNLNTCLLYYYSLFVTFSY